jgi:hypothetical protein
MFFLHFLKKKFTKLQNLKPKKRKKRKPTSESHTLTTHLPTHENNTRTTFTAPSFTCVPQIWTYLPIVFLEFGVEFGPIFHSCSLNWESNLDPSSNYDPWIWTRLSKEYQKEQMTEWVGTQSRSPKKQKKQNPTKTKQKFPFYWNRKNAGNLCNV